MIDFSTLLETQMRFDVSRDRSTVLPLNVHKVAQCVGNFRCGAVIERGSVGLGTCLSFSQNDASKVLVADVRGTSV